MTYEVFETKEAAAKKLAAEVAELIRSRAAEGKGVVLGLATGATPLPFYAELIRLHKEEGLSFKNVTTFNLDEYTGLHGGNGAPLDVGGTLVLPLEWRRVCRGTS